jgi:Ca2+/Na+ antiporter
MGILLKIFGGVTLMILGIVILMFPIEPLSHEPIDFIIDIVLIAGGMALFIKGGE